MAMRGLATLMAAGIGAAATGDVMTVGASGDNTLYESVNGALSNGVGPNMYAGVTNLGSTRRAVIKFDVSSIPAGATITKVELTLFMSRTIDAERMVSLHEALVSWGEGTSNAGINGGDGAPSTPGDATWIHRTKPSPLWANQGGDFDLNASSSHSIGNIAFYTWPSTAALVADVQGWLDDASTNHGWVIVGDEISGIGTAKRFDSRENATPANRPSLRIEFTPRLPCDPDFNGDGFLNGDDFDEFVAAFEAGDLSADYNGDAFVNGDDFDEYVVDFEAGC